MCYGVTRLGDAHFTQTCGSRILWQVRKSGTGMFDFRKGLAKPPESGCAYWEAMAYVLVPGYMWLDRKKRELVWGIFKDLYPAHAVFPNDNATYNCSSSIHFWDSHQTVYVESFGGEAQEPVLWANCIYLSLVNKVDRKRKPRSQKHARVTNNTPRNTEWKPV